MVLWVENGETIEHVAELDLGVPGLVSLGGEKI